MATVESLSSSEIDSKVLQASGPMALDFFQASCAPCRVLEPRLEHVAQAYQSQLAVYRVDIDRDLDVAERFNVMSLPTVLVFQNGKEVERLDGLIREDDLKEAFARVTSS